MEISSASISNCRNLSNFEIYFEPLKTIPEDLFVEQLQLYEVRFQFCEIENIPERIFEQNPILRNVYLDFNQLTELPFGLFSNNQNLRILVIDENQIEVIDSRSFRPLSNLFVFSAIDNKINAIDSQWFDFSEQLDQLFFANNICIDDMLYHTGIHREEFRRRFENCFDNFENLKN